MRSEEPAGGLSEGSGTEAERAEPRRPPRHLVWSTDRLDLRDPFQRKWYIRQVLLRGREEDLRTLDRKEVAEILEELNLPSPLHCLWEMSLERKGLVKKKRSSSWPPCPTRSTLVGRAERPWRSSISGIGFRWIWICSLHRKAWWGLSPMRWKGDSGKRNGG